jgi:hypothetical protein
VMSKRSSISRFQIGDLVNSLLRLYLRWEREGRAPVGASDMIKRSASCAPTSLRTTPHPLARRTSDRRWLWSISGTKAGAKEQGSR